MEFTAELSKIRSKLFYGATDYTKSQPDLFIPQQFQMLSPSQIEPFIATIKESIKDEAEILLYFHLPFCFSECLFCNSFPLKTDPAVQQTYLQHLLNEIDLFAQHGVFTDKKAKCIYFGGGTPTSFANSDLKRLIDKIKDSIELADNCSITSEAHPLTLSSEKRIKELAAIGLNRISIGCQTFDPKVLIHCNRSNTPEQINTIVKTAQEAGLAINVDMMTGLPGQTIASVRNDLRILEEIRPNAVEYIRHEIVNPLVVELYKAHPELIVADDTLFEMVYLTQEWMEQHGYEQNGRFSNDSQWGYRYYWLQEMPIIAFGLRTRSYTKTICYDKHEDMTSYTRMMGKGIAPIARFIPLSKNEVMFRSLILGLQLRSGLDIKAFQERFGESPSNVFASLIATLTDYGCLEQDAHAIRLTRYGAYFVEDVCDFVIDAALKNQSAELVRSPHSGGSRFEELMQETPPT